MNCQKRNFVALASVVSSDLIHSHCASSLRSPLKFWILGCGGVAFSFFIESRLKPQTMQQTNPDINSHPLLHRLSSNEDPKQRKQSQTLNVAKDLQTKQSAPLSCGYSPPPDHQQHWDCYPGMIRQIENQGSPKDVRDLHNLEKARSS
jgi:hypothetical protein